MIDNPLSVVTRAMGIAKPLDALVVANAIDVLRDSEGDSITFVCDNPDFNGQPNSKVICHGEWTGWVDRTFTGDTVFEALGSALAEYTNVTSAGGFNPHGSGPVPIEPREA